MLLSPVEMLLLHQPIRTHMSCCRKTPRLDMGITQVLGNHRKLVYRKKIATFPRPPIVSLNLRCHLVHQSPLSKALFSKDSPGQFEGNARSTTIKSKLCSSYMKSI